MYHRYTRKGLVTGIKPRPPTLQSSLSSQHRYVVMVIKWPPRPVLLYLRVRTHYYKFTYILVSKEQLKTAVESILSDNSFKINCAQAKIALKSAAALLEWRGRTAENRVKFASFSEELIVLLEQCFKESGKNCWCNS